MECIKNDTDTVITHIRNIDVPIGQNPHLRSNELGSSCVATIPAKAACANARNSGDQSGIIYLSNPVMSCIYNKEVIVCVNSHTNRAGNRSGSSGDPSPL